MLLVRDIPSLCPEQTLVGSVSVSLAARMPLAPSLNPLYGPASSASGAILVLYPRFPQVFPRNTLFFPQFAPEIGESSLAQKSRDRTVITYVPLQYR